MEVWVFLCPAHAVSIKPREHHSFPIEANNQLCACSGIDSHDSICRAIASRTPCIVVSVEYRCVLLLRCSLQVGSLHSSEWLYRALHTGQHGRCAYIVE